MKLVVLLLAVLLVGCGSSSDTTTSDPPSDRSWIGIAPGDALAFDGPGGELVLIYVDETYFIDDTNASALTWRFGEDDYTTDYFVEDDGTLWWYGRRGEWRAGKHGEEPREITIVDDQAQFGDLVITLSDDGPIELATPDGVYTVS